jgi:hypothetical protein
MPSGSVIIPAINSRRPELQLILLSNAGEWDAILLLITTALISMS